MDTNTTNLLTAFALLIIGVVAGGGGALLIIDHLLVGLGNSPVLITFLQHLADSASPELLKTVHDGAIVIEKVTEAPPPPAQAIIIKEQTPNGTQAPSAWLQGTSLVNLPYINLTTHQGNIQFAKSGEFSAVANIGSPFMFQSSIGDGTIRINKPAE